MSYRRTVPRDLFNEANLLKCYGHLYLCLENLLGPMVSFGGDDVETFDVQQRPSDGYLYVANLPLFLGLEREEYRLVRPLNSREPWPLYAEKVSDPDFEAVQLFYDDGRIHDDFRRLLMSAR